MSTEHQLAQAFEIVREVTASVIEGAGNGSLALIKRSDLQKLRRLVATKELS